MTHREVADAASSTHLAVSGAFADVVITKLEPALSKRGYVVSVGSVAAASPERGRGEDPSPTGPSIGILVADHDDPVLSGFRTRWRRSGRPLLEIVQKHPDVRVGPWDIPGTPACGHCFRMRARQHGTGTTPYEPSTGSPPAVSIDGFPPYLISIVVALAIAEVEKLTADPTAHRNEVTLVDTALLTIRTLPVIQVNGCPQCPAAPTPSDQQPFIGLGGVSR